MNEEYFIRMENSSSSSETVKNPLSGQISSLGPLYTFGECTTNKVFIHFSDYTSNFDSIQLSVVSTSFFLCKRRKNLLHFETLPSLYSKVVFKRNRVHFQHLNFMER